MLLTMYILPILFAILMAPYFFALFLGLTVWREYVQRPRVLGWSAFFLAAAIAVFGFGLPVGLFVNAQNGGYNLYSPYSTPRYYPGNDSGIGLTSVAGLFLMLIAASFCLCIAAIVPAPRPKMTPERKVIPTKHPLDD